MAHHRCLLGPAENFLSMSFGGLMPLKFNISEDLGRSESVGTKLHVAELPV
jgi:hypothetical protein